MFPNSEHSELRPLLVVLVTLLLSGPAGACQGDCNRDGRVTVSELVTIVAAALGRAPVGSCDKADGDADDRIRIDEVVGSGNIADFTYADLATLDAGYRFTPDDGATYPFRGQGLRLPALDEVLAAYPDQYFSIEIKPNDAALVAPLLAVLDAHDMRRRVVIASLYTPPLVEIRRLAPDVLTTMSLPEMSTLNALSPEQETSYHPPAPIVQAPFQQVSEAYMARATRLGLIIQAWTVDTRERMDALLARDVHGIITNDPALLGQAIADAE